MLCCDIGILKTITATIASSHRRCKHFNDDDDDDDDDDDNNEDEDEHHDDDDDDDNNEDEDEHHDDEDNDDDDDGGENDDGKIVSSYVYRYRFPIVCLHRLYTVYWRFGTHSFVHYITISYIIYRYIVYLRNYCMHLSSLWLPYQICSSCLDSQ